MATASQIHESMGHVRPMLTMGSDARSIRNRALENARARRLMRSKACAVILGRAADAITARVRGVQVKEYTQVSDGRGTAELLLAHGRWTGSVFPRYFDPLTSSTKALLEETILEMDRIAQGEDEGSLAAVMSAALADAQATGKPDVAAALYLRDCASLVRHLDCVYDCKMGTVIDEMPDFWMSAARYALDRRHRRRWTELDDEGRTLAECALRAIGCGGSTLTVDQPYKTWMLEIAWMLLRRLSQQSLVFPPAKAA